MYDIYALFQFVFNSDEEMNEGIQCRFCLLIF